MTAPPESQPALDSLYYGDCLEVMRDWPGQWVDLIYLDPPFNSKANYNQTFGRGNGVPAQVRAFTDTWIWGEAAQERVGRLRRAVNNPAYKVVCGLAATIGECGMLAYLSYMAERLAEMKRLLKPTGSIYLHCDPSASHYLKILMDGIFGANNFQNEFVWYYSGGGASKKRWARKHDTIFFYTKGSNWTFNADDVRVPYKWDQGQKRADGSERDLKKGKLADDVWQHHSLMPWSKEYLGYGTQKPKKLLERIIKASSNKRDIVLDPFCGGGTTLMAAANHGRRWIGIDISPRAVDLIKSRRFSDSSILTHGIPADLESARMMLARNAFDFEAWAVTRIEGLVPNQVKVGDGGIDGRGRIYASIEGESGLVIAQVKGGGYSATALRDFLHVMDREKATAGVFITLNKTTARNAAAEAAKMGKYQIGATPFPRLQFWSIEEHMAESRTSPKLPPMADPDTGGPMQMDLFN
ncbi:MAG: site-specific DNA-methyltransferase [Gammaproteobacteria bacterium]|nr:site-specific DNA-methyltransferase [Gammaproteobacteria bacterium]